MPRWRARGGALIAVLALLLLAALPVRADPLVETRYCGAPVRNAAGGIVRRADVLAAFQRAHPCPSTGLRTGPCAGWHKNHEIPLACGGCDSVSNLIWLPVSIKTCSGPHCVDRYERKISASTPPQPDTPACVPALVP